MTAVNTSFVNSVDKLHLTYKINQRQSKSETSVLQISAQAVSGQFMRNSTSCLDTACARIGLLLETESTIFYLLMRGDTAQIF